jgi:hypothetical protein
LDGAEKRSVAFDVKDYGEIDHGYAATVHKAQGVTVDRAHVLATPTMDRHMAYVALTRHREGVTLHYGADDFARGQGDVARVLGRERPKDTTLDYAEAFAERRGIVPVQLPAKAPERARGRFAGLKLGSVGGHGVGAKPLDGDRLEKAISGYADAWRDAARMTAHKLPVLPHQAKELDRAGRVLDAQRPHGAADLSAALRRTPQLEPGRAIEAMNAAGRARVEGKSRDLAKDIGPPPRSRDRDMER